MDKIKIHSIIDLITNSSTEIFTFYNNCPDAIIELMDAVLKTFDIDKDVNELFHIKVLPNMDNLIEYYRDENDCSFNEADRIVNEQIQAYIKDEIDKPEWIDAINNYSAQCGNELHIIAKDPKYVDLASKIVKLINSPSAEEVFC